MSALHFIGKTDTKEEMLVMNQHKEQAVLKTLLQDRDPHLYREIYGLKHVRDVYDPPTRGASGNHKTVRAHGAIELKLDPKVSAGLELYLPYVRAKTKHGYLMSTKRHGNRMSRKDMMLLLRRTTENRLGKRIGVQLIRVMKTTAKLKSIDEAAKLRSELAHGPSMQWKYVSRA